MLIGGGAIFIFGSYIGGDDDPFLKALSWPPRLGFLSNSRGLLVYSGPPFAFSLSRYDLLWTLNHDMCFG